MGPATNARAFAEAALRPDLEKIRFGHDLDPLKDDDAQRRRSSTPTVGAAIAPQRCRVIPVVLNKGLGFDRPPTECALRAGEGSFA
jgi:hypothetical protein